MKTDELLPLGSVVLLKDATKRLVITGYYTVSDQGEMYDYCAFLYPEGFLSPDNFCLFNHDQIDKVFFVGYSDIEREEFIKNLNDSIDAIKSETEKNNGSEVKSSNDTDFEQI